MPSAEIHRENLQSVFDAALARVNGRTCVRRYLEAHPNSDPVYVIAVGKPAPAMAWGVIDALDEKIADALIITKHGHGESMPWPCLTAAHPVPDAASLAAGDALLKFVSKIPDDVCVLVLLAGGASALVERLPKGVTLEQWQAVNDWVLGAGLDIHACNYIRKRISLIKGGRLAQRLAPRNVLCLILSDVPDNDMGTVGSGPLAPDSHPGGTPSFIASAPKFVRDLIERAPSAPAANDPAFANVKTVIVATLEDAKQAAAKAARQKGYLVSVERQFITGDAVTVGRELGERLRNEEPGTFRIWGGETQVTLPENPGRGGRSQSLALSAALALRGQQGVLLLAAGTDGTDGPTEEAGAVVDGGTVERGVAAGRDAGRALERADAGSFLEATGDLVRTGPTGTNVTDLILGLKY
ncbi:MAG: glycerate kinase [Acidiferrobacterales bacterium]